MGGVVVGVVVGVACGVASVRDAGDVGTHDIDCVIGVGVMVMRSVVGVDVVVVVVGGVCCVIVYNGVDVVGVGVGVGVRVAVVVVGW